MSNTSIKVSLTPMEAFRHLRGNMNSEIIYENVNEIDGKLVSCILVYEKYYFRNSSRASLTVTIDNFDGLTKITSIPSGGSQGMFLNFDWGAGENFASAVSRIFEKYTVS